MPHTKDQTDFQLAVLIVDDDSGIRSVLSELLTRMGCKVFMAEDGTTAQKILNDDRPHVLFTDFSLPDMTGVELIDLAKQSAENITGILMSGRSHDDLPAEATALIDEFVPKPFSVGPLTKLFSNWSRYHKLLDEVSNLKRQLATESEKVTFFNQAGHQLKAPTAVISEFVHLFTEGFGGDLSSKQDKYLEAINYNLNQLIYLIDNIENLTRVEMGVWPIRSEHEDPCELARLAGTSWRPVLEAQKFKFVEVFKEATPKVEVDASAVSQILYNLLDNARKYTQPAGTIQLRCHQADSDYVCIELENEGDMIPDDRHDTVFKPFERLPEHDASPGLGIGLTVARSLAEAMGGSLKLAKGDQSGVRFCLHLPVAQ